MTMPMLALLLCQSSSELNTPKLDNPTKNQMQLLLFKDKAREEFKQMKEKQTDSTKPMLVQVLFL